MQFGTVYLSLIVTLCVVSVTAWRSPSYVRRASKDCYIPRDDRYNRSVYRLRHGFDTRDLERGQRVSYRKSIIIFCKKDRLHDAIMRYSSSVCVYGRWRPALPNCIDYKRCNGMLNVAGAIPSERVGGSITYPHGKEVTYRCSNNNILVGSAKRICRNGRWSDVDFDCVDIPVEELKRCRNLPVANGKVTKQLASYPLTFEVKCKNGYAMEGHRKVFTCENGTWIDGEPECIPYLCPAIDETYVVNNDTLPQNTDFVHGISVTISCRGRTAPYLGVKSAKCYQGRWDPMLPVCRAICLLPTSDNIPSIFKYARTGKLAKGRVFHPQRITQTCRAATHRPIRLSTCLNGVWKPKFVRCPKTAIRTRLRSAPAPDLPFHSCEVPVDTHGTYFDVSKYSDSEDTNTNVYIMDNVDHGKRLSKICLNEAVVETNLTPVSKDGNLCVNGTWDPGFKECPGILGKCYLPEGVQVEPMKLHYYANDTLRIVGCLNSNLLPVGASILSCLDEGIWNGTVNCYSKNATCSAPTDTTFSYEPNKQQYSTGETINVTGCIDTSLHLVGTSDLTCSGNDEWSGAVDCITFCENGVETLDTTEYSYFNRTSEYEYMGVLPSVEQCFVECHEYVPFVCHSIETRKRSHGIDCFLIHEKTGSNSKTFIVNELNREVSKVYSRGCDDRCRIPGASENVTYDDPNGIAMVTGQLTETGAIVRGSCQGHTGHVALLTCMGGTWDSSFDDSLCEF